MSDLPVLSAIIPEGATPTTISLDFSPTITEEGYAGVVECLSDTQEYASRYLPIYFGDALVYGEMRWGETYQQYVNMTGLRVELLRNYKWVMGAVPKGIRQDGLWYGHYKAVAPLETLDERAAWLKAAVDEGWSTDELRMLIKSARLAGKNGEPILPPENARSIILQKPEAKLPLFEIVTRVSTIRSILRRGESERALRVLEDLARDLGIEP